MNKTIYTLTIAFISSLTTLIVVYFLSGESSLSATKNKLPVITTTELAKHNNKESCWKEIYGKVYDITDYINQHPTPPHVLTRWCGKESTAAWEAIRGGRSHSQAALSMLEHFLIGIYQKE